MIVVDTNIIATLLLPGPLTDLAKQAARRDQWCAPLLWRSELRNVLTSYVRHRGLPVAEARNLMSAAEKLFWGREFTIHSAAVFDCVARSRRSAYDCEFVALALNLGLTLVTTDEPIVQEFSGTALHLRDYVTA